MSGKEEEIFKKYLPEESVSYCHQLWKTYKIQLTISRPRKSVYGNYIYKNGGHYISVNGDLNPAAFLVTYLHEVAHLQVRVHQNNRTRPHGPEWQHHFRALLIPLIRQNIFEDAVAKALLAHIHSPKATSCSDPILHRVLMQEKAMAGSGEVPVQTLGAGSLFRHNSRSFSLLRKLRTRYECVEVNTHQLFRFQPHALVTPIENSMNERFLPQFQKLHFLAQGEHFRFNQKRFTFQHKRRTQVLCTEVESGKRFLISEMALVEKIQV